eukprot:14682451-Heterocapsa_arctica.AAC.1
MNNNTISVPKTANPGIITSVVEGKTYDRILVEGCCGPDSALCRETQASKGCLFGSRVLARDVARGNYNMTRGEATVKKIEGHWKIFRFLPRLLNAVRLSLSNCPVDVKYWTDRKVVAFLTKFEFKFTEFDGCIYGLVAKYGPHAGLPINKPWKVAYIRSSISDYLNRKCDHSHSHAPCSGQNTKATEDYTPEIANAFHVCFKADVANGLKACCAGLLHTISVAPFARAPAACCR